MMYWQLLWEDPLRRKWEWGVNLYNVICYLVKRGIAFARICWDNNILQFGMHCMSGSGPLALNCYFWRGWIHLLRGKEAILQWFGRCRSVQIWNGCIRMALEKKHVSDSVSIVSLFIENNVIQDIFWDSHTCYFENGQKKSHFTIVIAIHYTIVSFDSVWRSVGTLHDNIRWLALRIRSSLVLLILGENIETKNDNFSRCRVI